jgi:phage terminase large subunit
MFECSPVYYVNSCSEEQILINQGGTDSGKTYAIIQLLFTKITQHDPDVHGSDDLVCTVVSESIPNLKKGAYRIAKTILGNTPELQKYVKGVNETDRCIYFNNGYVMEFYSCQDEQSAKQGKRQFLFVNEANGVGYLIFWQLAKRTRQQVFIDYNPSAPFWAHEKLIGTTKNSNDLSASVKLIISDHRHNPFLSEEEHRRTEGIKDKELWAVYARGRTGNLTGLIFPDWRMIPNEDYPKDVQFTGGIDFGYTNDPTAIVKNAKIGNNIYLDELCYESGIAPIQIKQILQTAGFKSHNPVMCDHDPDMIRELRKLGIPAIAAKKGNGSINSGILKLKQFNVFYTERSKNLHMEKTKYMWEKDKLTGLSTNIPIDAFCHLMDATRYSETRGGMSY